MRFDWNDLRFFAALLEHGSTARAAKALGVDQTTCARRISALEAGLGVELFTRDVGGYQPTPAALMLQPRALAVAEQVACFAREAEAAGRRMRSQIRLSVDEYLISTMIVPALTRFSAEYPDVQVDVDASTTWRDLQAGEADIAIRAGRTPEEPSLVRRKLVDDPWAVYCSAAYAAKRGAPLDLADLAAHPMVCLDAALEGARALGLDGAVRQVVNSLSAALAVVRAGAHVGALPRVVADRAPDLRLCFPVPGPTAIWLVFPERLRHVPEVRALAALIAETFRRSNADAAEA